ncbi:hypothetical protein KJ903_05225 [Patescibacteria group bacterium]|nr:hypothetical protein [Patescibacteria group bacterium]
MLPQTKKILDSTGLLEKLPAESKDKLAEKIGETLEKKLVAALTSNVPADKVAEVEQRMDQNDSNLEQYLAEIVPNHQEILRQTVDDFTQEVEGLL